jgi:hypothetical protein
MPLDSPSPYVFREIKAWRERRGLDRTAAAALLHVPVRTLEMWEYGRACQCANLLRAYMVLLDEYDNERETATQRSADEF